MSDEVMVRVEKVSKKFSRSLKKSMRYGVADITRDFFGLPTHSDTLRPDEFWAMDDVSLEIRRGECLGIIGPNGSGKSTLLKMLNGIIMPDKGQIEIRGRVGALIEVGAGFHPMLTGLENIYVNGAILGMTRKEIDAKFDDIVNFSGLNDFLDMPVKFYSSGMFVRLGFSIAAHYEPEILLVDEVLSVGDPHFRFKCVEHIRKIMAKGISIVFISHNLHTVNAICDRVAILDKGKIVVGPGDPPTIIKQSYPIFNRESVGRISIPDGEDKQVPSPSHDVTIDKIELLDGESREKDIFSYDEPFRVRVWYTARKAIENPSFGVEIKRQDGLVCLLNRSSFEDFTVDEIHDKGFFEMRIEGLFLAPFRYSVRAVIADSTVSVPLAVRIGQEFQITSSVPSSAGIYIPRATWRVSE